MVKADHRFTRKSGRLKANGIKTLVVIEDFLIRSLPTEQLSLPSHLCASSLIISRRLPLIETS